MVARALLTWVIKAVRICMVDLKDLEAADARPRVGRTGMEHLLALEDVHLAPVGEDGGRDCSHAGSISSSLVHS